MTRVYSGLRAWLLQRVSTAYLLLFLTVFMLRLIIAPPTDYASWRGLFGPGTRMGTALFFLALALHAWIGLRDIALDYLRPVALRLAVLAVIAFGLVACVWWVFSVLWMLPT
jgi:succinate dehydrogenase / fumarate reductase membrane anchor subunit